MSQPNKDCYGPHEIEKNLRENLGGLGFYDFAWGIPSAWKLTDLGSK
jgi:hypothetical protein